MSIKAKEVTAIRGIETLCDDGHTTTGVKFFCDGFQQELPDSQVKKAGGIKSVKELVASFVSTTDKDAFTHPLADWLEAGAFYEQVAA
jgi:hypothetical protein